MAEQHLLTAARYIEKNPLKAGICKKPEEYEWSSTRAHKKGSDDKLVRVKPILDRMENWMEYISEPNRLEEEREIRRHENTGRPLGSEAFVKKLEKELGRKLSRQRPGPKRNN
jgi:putative transposase